MSRGAIGRAGIVGVMAVAAAAIAVLELGGLFRGRGALLVTLVLWTGIAQGCVAIVAAAELTGARWVGAIRRELLVAVHLLPLLALLFALAWPLHDLYGWSAHPGAWLNRRFFVARNLALLLATAGAAWLFAGRALRRAPSARRFAVAYLLLFVASQTLVAFDWVMSLAYPWVSSMFGMYFVVEGLYAGLAMAAMVFLVLGREQGSAQARRDAGLLLFGFSVLWGGLFFAQFMLIWYGNLPEEVGFVSTRLAAAPTRGLAVAFVAACFGVPFFGLISARAKRTPGVVGAVAGAVLLGLMAEKLFFMLPAVPLSFGALAVEWLLLATVWLLAVRSAGRLLPGEAGGDAGRP